MGKQPREGIKMRNFNFKRVICALLAVVCLFAFTACNKTNNGSENQDVEITNDTLVLTIGGMPVDYEEYRYFYLNTKNDMDGGDETYWTDNPDAEAALKESALTTLSQLYAIKTLAAKYDVTVSAEDSEYIDSAIQSMKDSYGEAEFLTMLEDIHCTLDLYKEINELSYLEYGIYETLTANGDIGMSEEEVKAELLGDDYVRAMHILYADKATAEGVLAQAKAATDDEFYELAQAAEDPGMIGNTAGYYFTYNQMVAEFEEACFSMEDGETSDLVETSYGYHIIRRLEKSPEYVDENYDSLASTVLQAKYYEIVDTQAATIKSEAKFEPAYDAINVTTAK